MELINVKPMGRNEPVNIQITGNKITAIVPSGIPSADKKLQIKFTNAMIFPGLINSHDHLDFNLFPALGDRNYTNYKDWGTDIHKRYKEEIAGVLKVPAPLRSLWGVYKNLLCGVTTVVNHGEPSNNDNTLLTVLDGPHCLHSVGFEKNWKLKLNHPLKTAQAAVIHVGEGVDREACDEIDQLLRWNLFRKDIIGVHGVAMTNAQAAGFKALVWCPVSNYFMFNKTAPVNELKSHTHILFGTDSTLTSDWNIWDHIRLARKTGKLTDTELYHTLNVNAANTWRLNTGEIAEGKDADVVIARMTGEKSDAEDFFFLNPADLLMVIHQGSIRMFDESIYDQVPNGVKADFSKVLVNGMVKYIQGDLPALINAIKRYYAAASIPAEVPQLVS